MRLGRSAARSGTDPGFSRRVLRPPWPCLLRGGGPPSYWSETTEGSIRYKRTTAARALPQPKQQERRLLGLPRVVVGGNQQRLRAVHQRRAERQRLEVVEPFERG